MSLNRELLHQSAMALDFPKRHVWTVQGFGMVRCYLDQAKQWRLNVWDHRLKVPGVSEIHDHPWEFRSYVLVGAISNTRFKPDARPSEETAYQHVTIQTGEGARPVSPQSTAFLEAKPVEIYFPGMDYIQEKTEIHLTSAQPGTVTLNDRWDTTPEHTARIYWKSGPWVNAEPRLATDAEVFAAIEQAREVSRLQRRARWG